MGRLDAETRQALASHVFDNCKRMRSLAVLDCGLVKGRARAQVSNTGRFFWNTSSFLDVEVRPCVASFWQFHGAEEFFLWGCPPL